VSLKSGPVLESRIDCLVLSAASVDSRLECRSGSCGANSIWLENTWKLTEPPAIGPVPDKGFQTYAWSSFGCRWTTGNSAADSTQL